MINMNLVIIIVSVCLLYLIGPWSLSVFINLFVQFKKKRDAKKFDPELILCPACGYRGDKRSNFKIMSVKFQRTRGPEKAALECTCLRCGAQPFVPLLKEADKWLANISIEELKEQTRVVASQKL